MTRTTLLLLLLPLLGVAACSSPTEPPSDLDPGEGPYVVSPAGVRIHGTSRILVIPARFADGPASPVSAADIGAQLFGGASAGALARIFGLASAGSFTLRGDVTPWVTTSITREAASKPGVLTESGGGDHVFDALRSVDATVDFGLYDNDGPDGQPNSGDDDGVVDGGVVVLHSEPNLYCDPTGRGTHPHTITQWRPNGDRFRTQDASQNGGVIEVGAYTAMSATGCSTGTVQSHVVAHELGHLLFALPDLYRFQGGSGPAWSTRRWIVGCWELMSAGSWGCGSGTPTFEARAAGFGAWARYAVGWVDPVIASVERDSSYELAPLAAGGTVLRLPITADEYLLIEYREKAPGDEIVPADGVLVYHIAESLPINPTNPGEPNRVRLIEADDDSALDRTELDGGDRGTAGDVFGTGRNTFRPGEHSRAVSVDGTPLPFELTSITIDAAAHRARVRVSPVSVTAVRRQ